jgi:hypothetical protein
MTEETTAAGTAATDDVPKCESCPFRAKAEAKPKSFLAWLWRVHTRFCPGWKQYQRWLSEREAGVAEEGTEAA